MTDGEVSVVLQALIILQNTTEWVQTLTDISRSAICCHSNKTRASTANPSNSAQLGGTHYHSPKLHPGPCVVWECGKEQTVHGRPWPLYTLPRLCLMWIWIMLFPQPMYCHELLAIKRVKTATNALWAFISWLLYPKHIDSYGPIFQLSSQKKYHSLQWISLKTFLIFKQK